MARITTQVMDNHEILEDRRKSDTSSICSEIILQVDDISLHISSSLSSISTITSADDTTDQGKLQQQYHQSR